ncbi:MAG: hypothetical protein D6739_02895 [Nitrospirae bacterium]|nr:MAG: hypothetical protein D6739_02895 [Nitrospirota bacterium]
MARIATGIALAAAALAALMLAPLPLFALLLAAVIVATQWEYYDLFSGRPEHAKRPLGLGFSAVVALSFYGGLATAAATATLATMGMLTWILFLERNRERAIHTTAITLFGMVYTGWNLGHLMLLRLLPHGRGALMLLFLAIWGADTAAYYAGKHLGRHRIFPAVSPKKTWEGSIAGLAAAAAAAALAAAALYPPLAPAPAAGLGLAIGVAGQLGDLFESMLKRSAGIKDSSHLLPGHGGLLDRLDSLIFATPVTYYLLRLVAG